jgi:hypothetical protein
MSIIIFTHLRVLFKIVRFRSQERKRGLKFADSFFLHSRVKENVVSDIFRGIELAAYLVFAQLAIGLNWLSVLLLKYLKPLLVYLLLECGQVEVDICMDEKRLTHLVKELVGCFDVVLLGCGL